MGSYVTLKTHGGLAYAAGHSPMRQDGSLIVGRVGEEFDVEQAKGIARLIGLEMFATLQEQLGSLDRVTSVIKVLGFVNAVQGFDLHPAVINGCSDLFVEVFGDSGRHARSAVGAGSLPGNIPVEIEAVFAYE
ncbi:MAG: RidA family protein [Coriobacteriia bacterium]|nr:RidA family protein [Coriobacteriia bacterium]